MLTDFQNYFTDRRASTNCGTLVSEKNKSPAVAEMGDRLATIDMGRKQGALLCPFPREGSWAPSNTMCRGPRSTSVPSVILIRPAVWRQQTLAKNWGLLSSAMPLLGGSCRGPYVTQCGLSRDLPPYQVASWSMKPFGHNTWAKIKWGVMCPPPFFLGGEGEARSTYNNVAWAEVYLRTKWHLNPFSRFSTTDIGLKLGAVHHFGEEELGRPVWPGPRPTSVPSFILIHRTVSPQHTNVTETDNGLIA